MPTYNPRGIDEMMKCLFCQKGFVDVIKLVPECGEPVCGECYEDLRQSLCNESSKYKCQACEGVHTMPDSGLQDCRILLRILEQKNFEKPLSDQAKSFKKQVELIKRKIQDLDSFDGLEYINHQCDSLELEVREAVESAHKHINEIKENLLKEINEYRQECLESFPSQSSNQSPQALSSEADDFIQRWIDYFACLEVLASDKEIDEALNQANSLNSRIQLMETELGIMALKYKQLEFKLNGTFFDDKNCFGKINLTRRKHDHEKSRVHFAC